MRFALIILGLAVVAAAPYRPAWAPGTAACADGPATSPDGGANWCTVVRALTCWRVSAEVPVNMRLTLLPDGGTGAYASDQLVASGVLPYVCGTSAGYMPDAGQLVCGAEGDAARWGRAAGGGGERVWAVTR